MFVKILTSTIRLYADDTNCTISNKDVIALQNDINWSIARWANVTDLIQKSQFQTKSTSYLLLIICKIPQSF